MPKAHSADGDQLHRRRPLGDERVHRPGEQQQGGGEEQGEDEVFRTQPLGDPVEEAEDRGADGDADRSPVADDERGEAEEALADGLALAVAAGRDHEHRPAEAGQRAGDRRADVAEEVDPHAERIRRARVLARRAEAQPEAGVPQQEHAGREQADADEHVVADAGGEALEDAGDVGHGEPVPRVDATEGVGCLVAEELPAGEERHRELADVAGDTGRVGERAALLADEQRGRHEPGDARGEDVDGETGDDVVDPERRRHEGEQQPAEQTADDSAEQGPPRAVLPSPPAAEHGAEDHHPLEADVDRAAALGVEAAETGHGDRRGGADGDAHRSGRRQVVVVGDRCG